jgi:hypothetical protein
MCNVSWKINSFEMEGKGEVESETRFILDYRTRVLNIQGREGKIVDSVTGEVLDTFNFESTDNAVFPLDGDHVLFNNGDVCTLRGEVTQSLGKLNVPAKFIITLPEPKNAFYTHTGGEINRRYSLFDPLVPVTHVVVIDDTDQRAINVFTWNAKRPEGRQLKLDHKFKFKGKIDAIQPFPGEEKVIVKFDKAFVVYDISQQQREARIDTSEFEEFYDVIPLPDGRIGTFVSIENYTYDAVYVWNLEKKERTMISKSLSGDFQGLWILNDPIREGKYRDYISVFARSQTSLKIIRDGYSHYAGDSDTMVNVFLGTPEDPEVLFAEETEVPLLEPPPEQEEEYKVKSLLEHTQLGKSKEAKTRQVLKLPHNINLKNAMAHYLPRDRYLVKYSWKWGEGFFLLKHEKGRYSLIETLGNNAVPLPRSDEEVNEMFRMIRELGMPIPTVLSDIIAKFM